MLASTPPTLIVGGTNGKGSSVTLAASIYHRAAYRVGRYTSPHLLDYNERIAIDEQPVEDAELCRAFTAIEQARGEIALTYFEFGTLAALWLFREAAVDVQVLEVGLGGRLDAVNIVDASCALVTNIGLDHRDWLGDDHEAIGYEKAGIFRAHRPAICVQTDPPNSLLRHAAAIEAPLQLLGRDFFAEPSSEYEPLSERADTRAQRTTERAHVQHWDWRGPGSARLERLPLPGLGGRAQIDNAAGVLAAIHALQPQLPVPEEAIRVALPSLRLRGRYERIGRLILDVAHNAEAAAVLADNLRADGFEGRVVLVLGMLADKPVTEVCAALAPLLRRAYFGGLPGARGLDGEQLRLRALEAGVVGDSDASVESAFARAWHAAEGDAIVLVCGSFLTVAAVARLNFESLDLKTE